MAAFGVAALLGAVLAGAVRPVAVGTALAALAAVLVLGAAAAFDGVPAAGVVAAGLVPLLPSAALIPGTALWYARRRLAADPAVPSPVGSGANEGPPGGLTAHRLRHRATLVNRATTALLLAVVLAGLAGQSVLAFSGGRTGTAACAVAAVMLALRARPFVLAAHRMAPLLAGAAGLGLAAVGAAADEPPDAAALLAATSVPLIVSLGVAALALRRRWPVPALYETGGSRARKRLLLGLEAVLTLALLALAVTLCAT